MCCSAFLLSMSIKLTILLTLLLLMDNLVSLLVKKQIDKENNLLKFVKISSAAHRPTKGSSLAAGYDLYSASKVTIPANGIARIPTDLKVSVPSGTYGRIAPRSGLAIKHSIDVGAGVIDEDYRGPVYVLLFNHGQNSYTVKPGDRIAQLICEKLAKPRLLEVNSLNTTPRNGNGFGSTGR